MLGFPATTIGDPIGRPEALDTGSIIMTGLRADDVIAGVEEVTRPSASFPQLPVDYSPTDTSRRVARFMLSTMSRHHEWAGIRALS